MVLTTDVKKKIMELVTASPCSIQELATHIQKNWRTADAYVRKLEEEGLVCIEYKLTKPFLVQRELTKKELETRVKEFHGKKDAFLKV